MCIEHIYRPNKNNNSRLIDLLTALFCFLYSISSFPLSYTFHHNQPVILPLRAPALLSLVILFPLRNKFRNLIGEQLSLLSQPPKPWGRCSWQDSERERWSQSTSEGKREKREKDNGDEHKCKTESLKSYKVQPEQEREKAISLTAWEEKKTEKEEMRVGSFESNQSGEMWYKQVWEADTMKERREMGEIISPNITKLRKRAPRTTKQFRLNSSPYTTNTPPKAKYLCWLLLVWNPRFSWKADEGKK